MKSFDDIEQMIKDSRVQATRSTDEHILQDAIAALAPTLSETSTKVPNTVPAPSLRRFRLVPFKVAAALILGAALLSVILSHPHAIIPESLALADIQKAVAAQDSVYTQGTRICTFPATADHPKEVYVYHTEKWASDQGYMDVTSDANGAPILKVCYDFNSGTVTMVYDFARQYYRFQVPPAYRQRLQGMTLFGLLTLLFQSGDYTPLKPTRIQGVKALGFQVTDLDKRLDQILTPTWIRFFFLNFKQSTTQLWINPKTQLPIYLQGDFDLDGCLFSDFTTMHLREINDQWQWGVSLDKQMLFPKAPEGFANMSMPSK